MKFLLLSGGSAGGFEELLARWFPPRLTSLDPEAHQEVLAYQYRIGRKGIERNPSMLMGAKIERFIVGRSIQRFANGTRESRQEVYG